MSTLKSGMNFSNSPTKKMFKFLLLAITLVFVVLSVLKILSDSLGWRLFQTDEIPKLYWYALFFVTGVLVMVHAIAVIIWFKHWFAKRSGKLFQKNRTNIETKKLIQALSFQERAFLWVFYTYEALHGVPLEKPQHSVFIRLCDKDLAQAQHTRNGLQYFLTQSGHKLCRSGYFQHKVARGLNKEKAFTFVSSVTGISFERYLPENLNK